MAIKKTEIQHLAKLAKLSFEEKQLADIQGDLEKILSFVDRLQQIDTQSVRDDQLPHIAPCFKHQLTSHPDTVTEADQHLALQRGRTVKHALYRVPKVIE